MSFACHSGRILSVETTFGAETERDWLRRRPAEDVVTDGERFPEFRELLEDMAVFMLPIVDGLTE